MSKSVSKLRAAIQNLDIKTPYNDVKFTSTSIEVPQSETPKFDVPQGFFMLAHSVFMNPILRELTGDAFRVFIWMSAQAFRFRDSDGTLRASIGYIHAGTGVSPASVSRIVDSLVKKKLIERVEVHSHKGNLWRVCSLAVGMTRKSRTKVTQDDVPRFDDPDPSIEGGTTLKIEKERPRSEGQINTFKSQILNNSLSIREWPQPIVKYFSDLRPARKRESEWKHFKDLLQDFPVDEVVFALGYVQKSDQGQSIHSPMAYLSVCMSQVLEVAKREEGQGRLREERSQQEEKKRLEQSLATAEEDAKWAEIESAFLQAHPTGQDQKAAITRLTRDVPFGGSKFRRSAAISRWWEETLSVRRSEGCESSVDR